MKEDDEKRKKKADATFNEEKKQTAYRFSKGASQFSVLLRRIIKAPEVLNNKDWSTSLRELGSTSPPLALNLLLCF